MRFWGDTMAGRQDIQPRTVLEQLLRQQDRTYEELAEDFGVLARRLGERGMSISARHLRRLASGERTGTTPATRRVLQAMFNRPVDELLQPMAHGEAVRTADGVVHTGRRQKEVLEVAAQRARAFAMTAKASVSNEAIEQVVADVRALASSYPQRPVTEILGRLVEAQDVLFCLLEARLKPGHARQLYFLSGIVGGLLAKASLDFADPHTALTHARTAFICADQADHNGLRAWVRGMQSLVAYWAGRPHESVRYAQSGTEFAQASHGTTTIWLPVSEARAWARLGNTERVMAAIERAERSSEQVRPDDLDEFGGMCTFGQSCRLYYAADALTWLPQENQSAERYSAQAVDAYGDSSSPEWCFSCRAGSHADLAIARVRRGELDGAIEALAPVLALRPEQRIESVIHSTRRLHGALSHSPLAARSEGFQQELEAFMHTPLPILPH